MAIKKQETIARNIEDAANAVSAIEEAIDEILSHYLEGKIVIEVIKLTIPRPDDLPFKSKVLTNIMAVYRQAGWTVNYINDQRDGDHLEFS